MSSPACLQLSLSAFLPRDLAILDEAVLAELRPPAMDEELLGELVGMFAAEAPAQLAAVENALDAGDIHEVEANAHSLKGTARNLGVQRVAALCAQLEAAAQAHDLSAAPALLSAITTELDSAYPALQAEVGLA